MSLTAASPASAPGMPATPGRPAVRGGMVLLGTLTAVHFVSDAYTSLLTPLLPVLQASFGVSIAQTALLVAVSSLFGSMLQPMFGVLADHSDRRLLVAIGPAICGTAMALLGVAPTYLFAAALVTLGGMGTGLFHPAAIAYVHQGALPRQRGLFASLFSAGGTAGQAFGPLVVTFLGVARLHWAIPAGFVAAAVSWLVTPSSPPVVRGRPKWGEYAAVFRGPMRLLWGASVLRSLCSISYMSLLGFTLTTHGFARHIGPSLAVYGICSAGGGILGGLLSDRLGRTTVLRSSMLLSMPLFVALVYTTPAVWWYYPLTALVGIIVNANTPVAIVTAQEYAPDHVATASALMMGFAWGSSGVLFIVIGALADLTSPRMAMVLAILLLLPALWLTVRLPEPAVFDDR